MILDHVLLQIVTLRRKPLICFYCTEHLNYGFVNSNLFAISKLSESDVDVKFQPFNDYKIKFVPQYRYNETFIPYTMIYKHN